MTLTRPLVIALSALALGAAGCGDDDDSGSASNPPAVSTSTEPPTVPGATSEDSGSELKVSADPGGSLKFEQESLTAKAGSVKFEFTNKSSTPHDFKIEKDGEEVGGTDIVSGDDADATVDLEAGEYTFYCSVGSHRGAGMEGTLTVE